MSIRIFNYETIDLNKISIGNVFSYGNNYNLINLYYNLDDKIYKLNIETPILFIPENLIYFNDKPFLNLSFRNNNNDLKVKKFLEWLQHFENHIKKILKKEKKINKKININTILKDDYYSNDKKLLLPINTNLSKCILTSNGIEDKDKFIEDWIIPTPTYGISLINFKNIWITEKKWGINLFCYALKIMPSHLLDPSDLSNLNNVNMVSNLFKTKIKSCNKKIIVNNLPREDNHLVIEKTESYSSHGNNLNETFIDEINKNNDKTTRNKEDINCNTEKYLKNHNKYRTFFRMKKMGIPLPVIEQKIKLAGLNEKIIHHDGDDLIENILELNEYEMPKSLNANQEFVLDDGVLNHSKRKLGRTKIKINYRDLNDNHEDELLVPSLDQITQALSNLKKINKL
tara:strand:- start:5130 stop:6329 length:1200 start_codon:yes stop_codon:yes gene_type:complete